MKRRKNIQNFNIYQNDSLGFQKRKQKKKRKRKYEKISKSNNNVNTEIGDPTPKKRKVQCCSPILDNILKCVPKKIKNKFINSENKTYLKHMLKFINSCVITFIRERSKSKPITFEVNFKELCLSLPEMKTLNNVIIDKNSIEDSETYIRLMYALNYPKFNLLNKAVVDVGLGNTKISDIKHDEKLLSKFTRKSGQAMIDSVKFWKDRRKTGLYRICSIEGFFRHLRSFFIRESGWTLSSQIVQQIEYFNLRNTNKSLKRCLENTIKTINKMSDDVIYKNDSRIVYSIRILCKILLEYLYNGVWTIINKNKDRRMSTNINISKIVNSKKCNNVRKAVKFKKRLDLDLHNVNHVQIVKPQSDSDVKIYKFRTNILIILFNRWSYKSFVNTSGGIKMSTDYIFKEFGKYIRSIHINDKCKFETKVDTDPSGNERKMIKKKMYFLRKNKNGGRYLFFIEKGKDQMDDKNGFYSIIN